VRVVYRELLESEHAIIRLECSWREYRLFAKAKIEI